MTIQEARKFVGQSIGLPSSFDGSVAAYRALSAARQTELTKALVNYINANPDKFTAAQVQTARAESNRAQSLSVEDTSYNWSEFVDEALDQGAAITTGAGYSIATAIVLAAVVFAGISAWNMTRPASAR